MQGSILPRNAISDIFLKLRRQIFKYEPDTNNILKSDQHNCQLRPSCATNCGPALNWKTQELSKWERGSVVANAI